VSERVINQIDQDLDQQILICLKWSRLRFGSQIDAGLVSHWGVLLEDKRHRFGEIKRTAIRDEVPGVGPR